MIPRPVTAQYDDVVAETVTVTAEADYTKFIGECPGQGAGDPSIFGGILIRTFEDSIKAVQATVDGPVVKTTGRGRGSRSTSTSR